MRILKLTKDTRNNLLEDLLKRSPNSYKQYEERVSEIIEKVHSDRDSAVFSYTRQFDGAEINEENVQTSNFNIDYNYIILSGFILTSIGRATAINRNIRRSVYRSDGGCRC